MSDLPDWTNQECTLLGYGKGAICSCCQYPPCHRPPTRPTALPAPKDVT